MRTSLRRILHHVIRLLVLAAATAVMTPFAMGAVNPLMHSHFGFAAYWVALWFAGLMGDIFSAISGSFEK